MARSLKAKERFRLQIVHQGNARGPAYGTYKIPGYLECSRKYSGGGQDSQQGNWLALTPGLFYQRHAQRTTANKGGRALSAQFEGVDILDQPTAPGSRLDWVG